MPTYEEQWEEVYLRAQALLRKVFGTRRFARWRDEEDALQEACSLFHERRTVPTAEWLAHTALQIHSPYQRTDDRRHSALYRAWAEKIGESGARVSPVATEAAADDDDLPDEERSVLSGPAREPIPRFNYPEEDALRHASVEEFRAALAPEERSLVDRLLDGATVREISKELGISHVAVIKRIKALSVVAQPFLRERLPNLLSGA